MQCDVVWCVVLCGEVRCFWLWCGGEGFFVVFVVCSGVWCGGLWFGVVCYFLLVG